MVIRTNLDCLAEVLREYNSAFYNTVFYENRMPTLEEAERFDASPSLLHWSGVRQVLPIEFNQNRDSLPNEIFERYCKSVIGVIKTVRDNLSPFKEKYVEQLNIKEADPRLRNTLLDPLNAYLWAIDDLESRVIFYYSNLEDVPAGKGSLSAFETALRHWYLSEYRIDGYCGMKPADVGRMYPTASGKPNKNVEKAYGVLSKLRSNEVPPANKDQLSAVIESLNEFPEVERIVANHLDLLR